MKVVTRQIPAVHAAAFTMVEIAISLAIIGFALVAIIGVLPLGLNVQRENREETIINQEATTLMQAIRSGARGVDDLTNAVFVISNNWTRYAVSVDPSGFSQRHGPFGKGLDVYTPTSSSVTSPVPAPPAPNSVPITNGYQIIGLLTTPKYVLAKTQGSQSQPQYFLENHVVACVRALSGLAAEKFPQNNPDVRQDTFSYRLTVENVRAPLPPDYATNAFRRSLANNLHEVRLSFAWPLLPNGAVGNGRQTYRTVVGGALTNEPLGGVTWFFQPQTFNTNVVEPVE